MEMVDRVAKAIANAHLQEDCWDSLTETVFDEISRDRAGGYRSNERPDRRDD